MHSHPRRLVDGNNVLVFVEHLERDGLRFCGDRGALSNFDSDFFAPTKMNRTFPCGLAVEVHAPGVDQFLNTRAA